LTDPGSRHKTHNVTKPVYALVGTDSFLQMQRLGELLKLLPPDVQRLDFDGDRADLADVLDELRSFAMFGSGKLVVVRNADEFISRFREQLEDYLNKPSDSGTLVLRVPTLPSNQRISKLIQKVGEVQDCNPPKRLQPWITERAKTAHQITIDLQAADQLADLIGDDLGRLDNELAKLALQSTTGKITAADVSQGVAFQREQEMWRLTDELTRGRPADAMKRWRQLVQMDSSAEFRAVTWLTIWLEKVNKAIAMRRKKVPPGVIAKELRIWPGDVVKPFFETVDALGEAGAKRAIDLLALIDKQSKSGVGNATDNVERFLLSLAIKI
jgi:DNA polymerase-3 subunit delta